MDSYEDYVHIVQPKYESSYLNVSIAWHLPFQDLNEDSFTYPDPVMPDQEICDIDFNLYQGVYTGADEGNSVFIDSSSRSYSSTEMVYVPLTESVNEYTFETYKYRHFGQKVIYGYAWSTDAMQYQIPTNTGIYYIQNKQSGYALDIDENGVLFQNQFHGLQSQHWVVLPAKKQGCFKLFNDMFSDSVGLSSSDFSMTPTVKTIFSGVIAIDMVENNDNTISLRLENPNTNILYAMQPRNFSVEKGEKIVWEVPDEEEDSQKWYFTKINYRKGDINENGVIDAYDYHLLESNINNLKVFSQSQKYLADMNEDGILNDNDIEVLDNYFKENDN